MIAGNGKRNAQTIQRQVVVRFFMNDLAKVLDCLENTAPIHPDNTPQVMPTRERRFVDRLGVLKFRCVKKKLSVI